ncbi:alpha/beta fold hydrolase [Paenibacillus sp. y28]|uniref:alpha/beta fold hydrolase n=1 Tax=Paenibacillus sp. y28 TaxID=3129110 RepID=UPI00301848A1
MLYVLGGSLPRRIRQGLIMLALVLICGALYYLHPHGPDAAAQQAMQGGSGYRVEEREKWIVVEPEAGPSEQPGIIFYPGALVNSQAYVPFGMELARGGRQVLIIKMPLYLSFMDVDRAAEAIAAYPGRRFVIGGHSLGGAMAARYAAAQPDKLAGVYLIGSYVDKKGSLKDSGLPVLTFVATNDGILSPDKFENSKEHKLPADALHAKINGGNHAQFGSYGPQNGDLPATITSEEQQRRTAQVLLDWLGQQLADTEGEQHSLTGELVL